MRRILSLLTLVALLSSCGGGGGGGDPFFGGVWTGTLSTTKNTCDTPSKNFDATITVNQLEGNIAVQMGSRALTGYIINDSSFTSSAEERNRCEYPDGSPAPALSKVTYTINFKDIDGDRATVTYAREAGPCIYEVTGRPGEWPGCEREWKGIVNRN